MLTRTALMTVLAAIPLTSALTYDGDLSHMEIETSFYVAGYSVRTNNADELSGRGQIGNLWKKFGELNLVASIPDRVDQRLIVVYSNYASDEKGEFSYLLGARVSSVEHLPAGLTYRKVASGPYAVFTTREGPLVEVLQDEWKKIWSSSARDLSGERAFLTDYEVYDQRSADREHAQVEIHIGLKHGAGDTGERR